MHLTTRHKVLIAGIAGAVVLIAGFYLLMSDFSANQRTLDLQFPGREQDGVPAAFYLAFTSILLVVASGIISGVCYAALDRAETVKNTLIRSAASGAVAGLLAYLAACGMIVVYAFGSGPVQAVVYLFTAAFDMVPFLIAIALFLAAFATLGGAAAKLTMMGLNKIKKSKA